MYCVSYTHTQYLNHIESLTHTHTLALQDWLQMEPTSTGLHVYTMESGAQGTSFKGPHVGPEMKYIIDKTPKIAAWGFP